jgi:hypothetical protein
MGEQSWKAAALVIVLGLSTCLTAAAVMDPQDLGFSPWAGVVIGVAAMLVSFTGLWLLQERRDRTLRTPLLRGRRRRKQH